MVTITDEIMDRILENLLNEIDELKRVIDVKTQEIRFLRAHQGEAKK